MAERALKSVPQLGMDEHRFEDEELEQALEDRESLKAIAAGHRKTYADADEKAKGLVQRLELPEGGVARVGRFRITRQAVPGRTVHFESKPSTRILIDVPE